MSEKRKRWIAPTLSLALLLGVGAEGLARPKPKDAEAFHRRIFEMVDQIPAKIGDWVGTDMPIPPAAVAMLRPNAKLQRRYVDMSDPLRRRYVDFLLVQCSDARDMGAHYPPVCYPGQGYAQDGAPQPVDWAAGGRIISGTEYHFSRSMTDHPDSKFVVDLLILPNGTFARDIKDIRSAAADYLRQYYGAAQIQVVFDVKYSLEERQKIFDELMAVNLPMIDTLSSGGTR